MLCAGLQGLGRASIAVGERAGLLERRRGHSSTLGSWWKAGASLAAQGKHSAPRTPRDG